jgi:hypothetical protein
MKQELSLSGAAGQIGLNGTVEIAPAISGLG